MSRSKRHTPITSISCCDSEKEDKRQWHGALRARERTLIDAEKYDDLHDNDFKEVSSPWGMGKDGKQYLADRHPELLRK